MSSPNPIRELEGWGTVQSAGRWRPKVIRTEIRTVVSRPLAEVLLERAFSAARPISDLGQAKALLAFFLEGKTQIG
jgi:hypothetical protein